jgi:hypothetical protein
MASLLSTSVALYTHITRLQRQPNRGALVQLARLCCDEQADAAPAVLCDWPLHTALLPYNVQSPLRVRFASALDGAAICAGIRYCAFVIPYRQNDATFIRKYCTRSYDRELLLSPRSTAHIRTGNAETLQSGPLAYALVTSRARALTEELRGWAFDITLGVPLSDQTPTFSPCLPAPP